ncbi:hypothetical protein EV663_1302 [Rhodovulum bhavnagarense]|uniref:HTH cro/C1-type domain-containing protein n=1 Tax=Rhodovulum bhavnagarense TaxID=992286 RepID=A0A4R2R8X4_9RHOB|nr:transcriptional regulator [Rhodovulum bhavnagarense]TCP58379.1 hypothetical protein EV663_1302 [Rhodovulum bhavnagarense]
MTQGVCLTGRQVRAARAVLRWSVKELSERSGVGFATIVRYEEQVGVPRSRKGNLEKLRLVFETAGIEFVGTPDDRPGLRIGTPRG